MIIKQLTEIKTTVNPASTLVVCNASLIDTSIQNRINVIDKAIQNKKKNANKNLANTETLNTTDNFTSSCLEHPIIEKHASTRRKNSLEASQKKN